ncbi:MAG TPA: efflux RND transporter periplasmic adaptor subunit [Steroidobacteraceae bacterium]|nr:efflux RND transporter periplasmic adaptor subunit [Steroidobacteraceae bacterium]HNS27476.1 efflux RND transporter periplasmic adaptor subunit [Steroidobacteraceae bacterium]
MARRQLALTALVCASLCAPFAVTPAAEALAALTVETTMAPLERMLDGRIEAVNQATVSAQTSGRIAEILYDVNDFVPAGAVILRLRATEQRAGLAQAQAALREAIALEAESQAHYTRTSNLYKEDAASKAQLEAALAARDAAVARLAAARAGLDAAREGISYTEVRAPYAGVVTQRLVEVGEAVRPGTPLMSGLSLQFLRVTVDLPQSVVEQVRGIRKAAVYVDGQRIEATGLTIFPQASSAANTFRARVELPENAADLYPGMLVKVGFIVGEAQRLTIPASALVERSEVTAVYVLGEGDRPSLRQVRVGRRSGERLEILAGLVDGERIAIDPHAAARVLRESAGRAP